MAAAPVLSLEQPSTAERPDLLEGQFDQIKDLLYDAAGIKLTEAKRELVRSRLARRLRALGSSSVAEYVAYVSGDTGGDELVEMVDALTTNKTGFFREIRHFDLLEDVLADMDVGPGGPTIWSAGCSTGEEPYTLAMMLAEQARHTGKAPGRVLATDISGRALGRAIAGIYTREQVEPVAAALRRRYLVPASAAGAVQVTDDLRSIVRFARLNLVGPWPMRGPFDVIFCRNVMIYFDAPTKERLVDRLTQLITPGGFLFVGHSESLSSLGHSLRYVHPAVYQRT